MHFYVICLCDDLLHCADKLMDLLQRVPLCQLSRMTSVWVVESVTIESQALFCQSCFFLKKKSDLCPTDDCKSTSKLQNVYPQYYNQRRQQRSGMWFLNAENK